MRHKKDPDHTIYPNKKCLTCGKEYIYGINSQQFEVDECRPEPTKKTWLHSQYTVKEADDWTVATYACRKCGHSIWYDEDSRGWKCSGGPACPVPDTNREIK